MIIGLLSAGAQPESSWNRHLRDAQELHRLGNTDEARREFQLALAEAHTIDGDSGPTAQVLSAFGVFESDLGNFAEAEDRLRQSLAIWSRRLGPEHFALAREINHLAAVYIESGQIGKAERLGLETWWGRIESNPQAAQDRLPLLENLAMLDGLRGRAAQGELRLQQALALASAAGVPKTERAVVLNNLGLISLRMSRPDSAISCLIESLGLWKDLRGPDDGNVAVTTHALGLAYAAAGRSQEAESAFKQAVRISEETFGPASIRTAAVLESYAELLRKLHRKSEAKQMSARAGGILREAGPQVRSPHMVDITELSLAPRTR
jgi:tetratricopeptide (TPR) repeat protein